MKEEINENSMNSVPDTRILFMLTLLGQPPSRLKLLSFDMAPDGSHGEGMRAMSAR